MDVELEVLVVVVVFVKVVVDAADETVPVLRAARLTITNKAKPRVINFEVSLNVHNI